MPNITPEQIESLLSELQTGLVDLAKSEAAKTETLSKAHPGEETKDEGSPDVSATSDGPPQKDESKPATEDHSAEKTPDGKDESKPDMAATDPASTPGVEDPAAMDDGPIDPIKLHEEYSKLSPEDLKAHYIACKAALFEIVGSGDGDADDASLGPDASVAPAPPSPAATPPAPDAPPTMKGEKDMSDGGNGGNPLKMTKSEDNKEIELLKKELADRDTALSNLAKTMEKLITTPIRKSVVNISDVQKPATKSVTDLSREEVRAKLRDKVTEGKLNKSEMDLVIDFDLGKVKVQDVAHLLESKAS